MDNIVYTLVVIANFPNNEERTFDIEDNNMSQDALEDAVIAVIDGNYDASSFVLTITRRKV